MNLAEMTDINELKALGYDQIVALEQAQQNLRMINARIAELTEQENKVTEE